MRFFVVSFVLVFLLLLLLFLGSKFHAHRMSLFIKVILYKHFIRIFPPVVLLPCGEVHLMIGSHDFAEPQLPLIPQIGTFFRKCPCLFPCPHRNRQTVLPVSKTGSTVNKRHVVLYCEG